MRCHSRAEPSRAEAQSGTPGPRRDEFSRSRFGSRSLLEAARQGPFPSTSTRLRAQLIRHRGKLRLHDWDTVVQHGGQSVCRKRPPSPSQESNSVTGEKYGQPPLMFRQTFLASDELAVCGALANLPKSSMLAGNGSTEPDQSSSVDRSGQLSSQSPGCGRGL